jgi:hypothetical protein
MGMFIIQFTMPKKLVVILENKKCLKITLDSGPYAMDKKIYILVANCFKQTLFIS